MNNPSPILPSRPASAGRDSCRVSPPLAGGESFDLIGFALILFAVAITGSGCEFGVDADFNAGFEQGRGTNDVHEYKATGGGELKAEIPGV